MKYSIKYIGLFFLPFVFACNESKNTVHKQAQAPKNKLPYYNEPSFTPIWIDSTKSLSNDFHKIPAFSLFNQNGDTITERNLTGKVCVVDFFFTTCAGICPKMTSNMKIVHQNFKDNDQVLLLSHSVTPKSDSIAVLKKYATNHDIDYDNWHLITGDQELIYNLGRKAYFVEEDLGLQKTENDFLHTENFILIDKQRRIRGIYNGLNKASIQNLISDIKSLIQEN